MAVDEGSSSWLVLYSAGSRLGGRVEGDSGKPNTSYSRGTGGLLATHPGKWRTGRALKLFQKLLREATHILLTLADMGRGNPARREHAAPCADLDENWRKLQTSFRSSMVGGPDGSPPTVVCSVPAPPLREWTGRPLPLRFSGLPVRDVPARTPTARRSMSHILQVERPWRLAARSPAMVMHGDSRLAREARKRPGAQRVKASSPPVVRRAFVAKEAGGGGAVTGGG